MRNKFQILQSLRSHTNQTDCIIKELEDQSNKIDKLSKIVKLLEYDDWYYYFPNGKEYSNLAHNYRVWLRQCEFCEGLRPEYDQHKDVTEKCSKEQGLNIGHKKDCPFYGISDD